MRVPFSFLKEQFADPQPIFRKIEAFLKRCDFTLGEEVAEFEKRYAEYCGVKFAVGVGSGTDALAMSLRAAGVQPGDEVITAPNSFVATVGAIVQAGATPVFADVGPDFALDPRTVEAKITDRTAAIMPVHWAGYPADMPAFLRIAEAHQLVLVEDACQALGARLGDGVVGAFGAASAFSLHPIKPLHVWGDGGMIVTDCESIAAELRLMRNHGLEGRDVVRKWGFNSRLDNLHAIVGLHVMETLEDTIATRIALVDRYRKQLDDLVEFPPLRAGAKHVYHLFQVKVARRDELLAHLNAVGIEAKVHYPIPLHLQPAAADMGHRRGDFPVAEMQSEETITLPCHQFMNFEQVDFVGETIRKFYRT